MKTKDFYYDLPKELIAQHPTEKRDHSRLLVLDKKTGEMEHKHFYDIIDYLKEGDVLVLNDTKVMPARIFGHREGKEEKIEFLLLNHKGDTWECLSNSAAAPTAGLHFTQELLQKVKDKGVEICYITLHVGIGTFRPVKVENIDEHEMHSEFYIMTKEVADKINAAKDRGSRVIAVGTTSVRTVESIADESGRVCEKSGFTNIFIYPPYKFKCIDALITNFHLPESTLLMLVSSLSTREIILKAYKEAVKERYRFFSFGDAMFIR